MADDRWDESRDLWGRERRQERERERRDRDDYARTEDQGAQYGARRGGAPGEGYRPFGDSGPIYTAGSGYTGEGRPYGRSGRFDELSPEYRSFEAGQRRIHRGDYDRDAYVPNPRDGRGDEARNWWERTQDEVSSWFGDENARRRREWDERRDGVHDIEQGQHRGKGPKGYRRSDARMADDISDHLTDDPYVDASDIEVAVKDGEATLSGTVTRREDKRRAEDLAEAVSGVSHVQNNLRVRRDDDAPRPGDARF